MATRAKTRTRKQTKQGGKKQKVASMVREVLTAGITGPKEAQAELKNRFGVDVSTTYISNIKSTEAKKTANGGNKTKASPKGPKPSAASTQESQASAATTLDSLDSTIVFIKKVGSIQRAKELIRRIEEIKNL